MKHKPGILLLLRPACSGVSTQELRDLAFFRHRTPIKITWMEQQTPTPTRRKDEERERDDDQVDLTVQHEHD